MEILGSKFILRPFRAEDASSLAKFANDKRISCNLRDAFPHPYTLKDAEFYIENIASSKVNFVLAIDVQSQVCGSIGVHPGMDVYRLSGEIGYWLCPLYHRQGIGTEAVRLMTQHAFEKMGLIRLYAAVFEGNIASMKTLEKAGYKREGKHRNAVIKEGRVLDEVVYACLKEEWNFKIRK